MPQVKIFGLQEHLEPNREKLSDVIHSCLRDALNATSNKRFHRFFYMDRSNFIFGPDRADNYTIIEIMLFEGRSGETKKKLINLLFEGINENVGISKNDLEIILIEIPKSNWGIRGMTGDEMKLDYKVEK